MDTARRAAARPAAAPPFLPSGEGKGPTSGYGRPKESAASDVTAPVAEHAGTCSPWGSWAVPAHPSPGAAGGSTGHDDPPRRGLWARGSWSEVGCTAEVGLRAHPCRAWRDKAPLLPWPVPLGPAPADGAPAAPRGSQHPRAPFGAGAGPCRRPMTQRAGDAGRAAPRSVRLRGLRRPLFTLPSGRP